MAKPGYEKQTSWVPQWQGNCLILIGDAWDIKNISSHAKQAILYKIAQSSFLHNCRIIIYISALLVHFILPGEQVLFQIEGTCTSKSEFSTHWAILHQFAQFFFLHRFKIKKKTSVSSYYFIFTGEGPYSPT